MLIDTPSDGLIDRVDKAASLPVSVTGSPDGYRALAIAREGARVVVYKAVRKSDNLPVLLKTPRSARPTERDLAQFAHEVAALARLVGAPVALALATENTAGRPWIVLEDPGGESLNRIAARFRAPARAVAVGAKIAGALAEVHRRGVVHRDVKPHHVIVLDDGSVRLTDFRCASLSRVDSTITTMHGSLAYMAPEQTGRMNRPVDKRADLYALGVTLYELVTGRLPFEGNDPLEWVHAHIAKTPLAPSRLDERIPASVDAIILKLLSKRAEDRYHGATGVQRDLERCAAALERDDTHAFELGTDDAPDDFRVAHRLYGREDEVAQLKDGFDRARSGSCVVTLITGYSGVGKSSLVCELFQPVVRERGRFVSGKFDQYKRDIPYATIVQAFRDLLRGFLAVGEASLDGWRDRLREALGANGRVIADVVPELALIIGPQPPLLELDPHEGQNRFELVFSAFVRVFARADHPLVVFLDDMQWADGATLGVLNMLARPGEVPYLQLVLAFRSNEVDAGHPFHRALDVMRTGGARVDEVNVSDLGQEHVLQLVADTVARRPADAASLASMVGTKAGGNPFFIGELLQVLHTRGLLAFDAETYGWTWDEAAIGTIDVTHNVVDLLIDRIRSLPAETRHALTMASCFGSRFDLVTLATVADVPLESLATALEPALAAGLVVVVAEDSIAQGRALRFQHDRIQQAAYSLVLDERPAIHLRIGRVLRSRFVSGADVLFDAVKHLDHGSSLVTDAAERQELVELNLLAARRAKAAIAWEPARVYLQSAASLLGNDAWTTNYETTFAVLLELAECEILTSQFAAAESRFDELRRLARSRAERGDVANSQVKLYVVMGRYDEALRLGLAELEPFGEPLVANEEDLAGAITLERQRLASNFTGLDIRSIVDRPVITDPEPRALIVLLTSLAPTVYSRRPSMFPLLAMRIVNLSLEHGNCEHSCYGYSLYAMMFASVDGDSERALTMSEASIALNERFRDPKLRGTVLHIHANHIVFWQRPYAEASSLQEQAYMAAMDVGDLTIAAYVSFMGGWQCLARGQALSVTERSLASFEELARGSHHAAAQHAVQVQRQFVRALSGLTKSPLELSDEKFDADEARTRMANAGFDTGLVMHDLLRAKLAWHHGDYSVADSWLARGSASLPAALALPLETTWALFDALTAAALWDTAPPEARDALVGRVTRAEARLSVWARGCAENFGAEHALVAAELARLEDRTGDALCGYEQAADAARKAGMLPLEIIAAKLAIRLARSNDFARATRSWLRDAHDVVTQWGATALLSATEASAVEPRVAHSTRNEETFSEHPQQLDVLTAIKASQALSRETTVEGLTQAMLKVVLEHAGAQRAVVLLVQQGRLGAVGAASIEGHTSDDLPDSIVRYVERTRSPVVLADAAADPTFADDAYVARTHARSVLCLPILARSHVVGLLYLENNLVAGAFSPERIALLEVVATQLAISLDNEKLYEERQERAEQAARQEAIAVASIREQSRLAALFAQAPAAIAVLEGRDHVITLANPRYHRMAGDRPLENLPVREAFPEVPARKFVEQMDRVFETGEALEARDVLVALQQGPDGPLTDGYYDFVYQPFRDANQAVKGIMVVAFDVSDRVHALHALQDSEQRLRLAIEASAIGGWEMDLASGTIVRSDKFDEIFGYREPPASWTYAQLLAHVVSQERAAVAASFEAAVEAAGTWVVECKIGCADGRFASIEVRGQLRRGRGDGPKRMFGTVVDITLRKTAETERQELTQRENAARREAEAANRSKDEFLAMLGHELRNPLAPIVTALHVVRLRDGERNHNELSLIERQVVHLVRLVDDLLDVSRITSGKVELQRAPIEIAEVIAKAIELASPLLEQRRHELTVTVPRHGVATFGDMTRLAQVISNLLANAAKYTEPGGRVSIVAERIAENIEVRVRDTGIGIAPEMLPRVFDLFTQEAQALSRAQGGLGLGLAIVRSLISLHGGTVSAQSAGLGRGTELTIRLPAIDLPASPISIAAPSMPTVLPANRGSHVLVVDDNEDAADLLAAVLKEWGYTVRVAYDGPTTLQLVAEFTPEIALLDIGLPVMDGYELARLLKVHPNLERTHLVALTGYGQETDRQRSKAAGFDAHLVKPIDMSALETMMTGWSRKDAPPTSL